MPVRIFTLSSGIDVPIIKNARSKHIKLSIDAKGNPRLSMPKWVPYRQAEAFILSREDWINKHVPTKSRIYHDMAVGKYHRLEFKAGNYKTVRSKVKDNSIQITLPIDISIEGASVQSIAEKACLKALTNQANNLLPQRVHKLSKLSNKNYKVLKFKNMKTRWGSCTSNKEITLNVLLMQLSWEQIDYVILHELTHTEIMSHSKEFWNELLKYCPKASLIKKQIAGERPILKTI